MIDKALIIIIFFYAAGLMMVGFQYSIADVYNITLEGCKEDDERYLADGVTPNPTFRTIVCTEIESNIVGYIRQDSFNERTGNIATANYTTNSTYFDKVETFTTGAAFIAWELVTLMTGTYIFWMMGLLGVPTWMITMFVMLYALLLARAIIGYVRGI